MTAAGICTGAGHRGCYEAFNKDDHGVSQEWPVDYVRAYIVNASPSVQDDFRGGFIAGYGEGGESVLNKAVEKVRRPMPPPPNGTASPAPGPGSSPKQQP